MGYSSSKLRGVSTHHEASAIHTLMNLLYQFLDIVILQLVIVHMINYSRFLMLLYQKKNAFLSVVLYLGLSIMDLLLSDTYYVLL